jgi:gliding motility-associated-like protein
MCSILPLSASAQQGSWGNTFINSNTEMVLYGQHNFQVGTGFLPGIMGTERTSPVGAFSFITNSSWTGASDNAYVDGYVKTYLSNYFIFPIGDNGSYRPAAVSTASLVNPAWAAYYGVNPGTATTSSLKGGNEPVLPAGGPFDPSLTTAVNLVNVSTVEYWDIAGATPARITLTWNPASAIGSITENDLTTLTIAGWNGSQWEDIPSSVDATSLFGTSSTLSDGSITTSSEFAPNTYKAYTLARNASKGTPLVFSKRSTVPVLTGDGTYRWMYILKITNVKNVPFTNLQMTDNLANVFTHGENFQVINLKASGNLVANGQYDGVHDIQLLVNSSYIPALGSDSVTIELKVDPKKYNGVVLNQATLNGTSTETGAITVTSNGPNGGTPGNPAPTPTTLPEIKYTIPYAFSPNGDHVNDYFEISHDANTRISLEVFNRWGNRVYKNDNYQNEWNGQGNGNFLGQTLLPGTYFYIVTKTDLTTGKETKTSHYLTLSR